MREEEVETAMKVVVVGNGAVGKSSMIQSYCKGVFTNEYKKTIGVDFLERQIEVYGEDVRLMLWDTAGQEEFDAITKVYYRGAQGCVLVFSTTDRESYRAIESWKKKVEAECGPISMVLVQNKIDLLSHARVSREEAEALAQRLKVKLFRTSVKENVNVADVFRYLAELYLKQLNEPLDDVPPTQITFSPNFVSKHHKSNGHHRNLADRKSATNGATITLHPGKYRPPRKKSALKSCTLL